MTVTVTMKPDGLDLHKKEVVKFVCECGYEDKAYEKEGYARAMQHITKKHGGKGGVRSVRQ